MSGDHPTDTASLSSWGGLTTQSQATVVPARFGGPVSVPHLAYGNGRSYGDSCLNADGTAILSRRSSQIRSFDPVTGVLEAEAGVILGDVLARVAPQGWFLPVVPGTQLVTLGGAIANDIHGKNHHIRGTFGCHVKSIELVRSDTGVQTLSANRNAALFRATIGGMGLTGLIRRATIQLVKVPGRAIDQVTTRFSSLDDYFKLVDEADARHEYAVAWIDSLAKGARLGRGHLIAGDHVNDGSTGVMNADPKFNVPFTPPITPLQGPFLRFFNEAYFRRVPNGQSRQSVTPISFFFPLDKIGRWNKLYGPRGLHQHQSVIPNTDKAFDIIRALLEQPLKRRHGSFLTVLKRFGACTSPGLLSFPRHGYTLTLDFPDRGPATMRLLDELDEITLNAMGRVNPYKDRRMSAETFAASFPQWRELEAQRDPAMLSDFWRRTALQLPSQRSEAA